MRPFCLFLAALTLASCSTVKLAYNQADWLLVRYLDDYVALDTSQRERFESQLQAYLHTHRRERLPDYLVFVETTRERVTDGLTQREMSSIFASLQLLYRITAAETAPLVAPVLANLTPKQIDRLARKLAQDNREYTQDYLAGSQAERRKARSERVVQRVEKWTGRLTRQQNRLLSRFVKAFPDIATDWYDYRVAEQTGLLKLLRTGSDRDTILSYLLGWWVWQVRQPTRLEQKKEELDTALKTMLVTLDATLTAQQRRHLLRRLDRLANDLAELSSQAPKTPARAGGTERLAPNRL